MIIQFDIPTPSLNKLKGKWGHANSKKKFLSRLKGYELLTKGLEKKKRYIKIICYHSRQYDEENFIGGTKGLVDALKEKGFFVDDSPKWLEREHHQVKCKRGEEKTIVIIQ